MGSGGKVMIDEKLQKGMIRAAIVLLNLDMPLAVEHFNKRGKEE